MQAKELEFGEGHVIETGVRDEVVGKAQLLGPLEPQFKALLFP